MGEVPAQFIHLSLNRISRIQRIGAGFLPDGQSGRRHAVIISKGIGEIGPQFRSRYILDSYSGSVRIDADRNIGKFLGSLE